MKSIDDSVFTEPGTFRVICHTCSFFNKNYRLHWHSNCEICRVVKGKCTFCVGDSIFSAETGDVLILEKDVLHRFVIPKQEDDNTDSSAPVVVRILQFAYPLLFDSVNTVGKPQTFITNSEIAEHPGLSDKINSLLDLLESETVLGLTETPPYVRHLVSALFFLLSETFPAEGCSPVNTNKSDFYLTVSYIKEHFKENLTTEVIAKALGIPRRRLAANFISHSGIELNEYIRIERVNYVNYLLGEGLSISTAAMESGFQNLRTFGSTYKRLIGCTPSEYLKKRGTSD